MKWLLRFLSTRFLDKFSLIKEKKETSAKEERSAFRSGFTGRLVATAAWAFRCRDGEEKVRVEFREWRFSDVHPCSSSVDHLVFKIDSLSSLTRVKYEKKNDSDITRRKIS